MNDLLCVNGEEDDEAWSDDDSDSSIKPRDIALEKRGPVREFEYDFKSPIDNQEYVGS